MKPFVLVAALAAAMLPDRRAGAERRHHPGERQGDHARRPLFGGAGHRDPRRQDSRNRHQRGRPQARRCPHQGDRPRRPHRHPGIDGFPHSCPARRAHLFGGAELDRGAEPRQGPRPHPRGRAHRQARPMDQDRRRLDRAAVCGEARSHGRGTRRGGAGPAGLCPAPLQHRLDHAGRHQADEPHAGDGNSRRQGGEGCRRQSHRGVHRRQSHLQFLHRQNPRPGNPGPVCRHQEILPRAQPARHDRHQRFPRRRHAA